MLVQIKLNKGLFLLAGLALLATAAVSCGEKDENPVVSEQANPAELMAGAYDCSFRLAGGQQWGNWVSRLIITVDSNVWFDHDKVLNPTFKTNSLSWSTLDGNNHNANLEFYRDGADSSYWQDNPPDESKNFSGVYSRPRDAPLDMRAVIDPD